MLKRSLFALPIATPTTPDSATIELPPLAEPDLAQLGRNYEAVWFTYQYFDVGPSRQVEECTETLRVGHMTATFSPDVIHRLQHFIQAFRKSSAAVPRFSEGTTMCVLCVSIHCYYYQLHVHDAIIHVLDSNKYLYM